MKILIINPNSDEEMTDYIQITAEKFCKYEDNLKIHVVPTPGANSFIGTYKDIIQSAPGMVKIIQTEERYYDGFLIACGLDPNIDLMKEVSGKPVVGIAESSMKIATMLGNRFGIIQVSKASIPRKEELIKKYELHKLGVAIAPEKGSLHFRNYNQIKEVAVQAIEKYSVEVIVLSCAGMSGLDERLSQELNIPVLDGIKCGLSILTGLIKNGYSISKIGKFKGN